MVNLMSTSTPRSFSAEPLSSRWTPDLYREKNLSCLILLHKRMWRGHHKRLRSSFFFSYRGLNLFVLAPCLRCMYTCVDVPVKGKSRDQGSISQPTIAAKSHLVYTKYTEKSIFHLIFIKDFSFFLPPFFCFFHVGGMWSMNFASVDHNQLAHESAGWPLIYFSHIFFLHFVEMVGVLVWFGWLVCFNLGGASSSWSIATGY